MCSNHPSAIQVLGSWSSLEKALLAAYRVIFGVLFDMPPSLGRTVPAISEWMQFSNVCFRPTSISPLTLNKRLRSVMGLASS